MYLVQAKNISKKFANRQVLSNINFSLKRGEVTTLVGQNGAGKTTLAKIIAGQEKYDQGQLIMRKNINIAYLPQKLDFNFTMPINSAGLLKILAPKFTKQDLVKWQYFLPYEKISQQDIKLLSGGERQKLFLIGTILAKPDLLILDEPNQYLDFISQKKFYQLIAQLKQEQNMAIFIISHDLFTVMKNSDQVICLNGHICCSGRPAELSDNQDLKQALSDIGLYIHQHNHHH